MAQPAKRRKSEKKAIEALPKDVSSVQDIFRKHFEAQFKPLPEPVKKVEVVEEEEEEDNEEDEEWDGLEDDEDAVEVVDYSANRSTPSLGMSKHERKAFMGNKPIDPTVSTESSTLNTPTDDDDPDAEDSATLLKQDLELQRLISESHLLSEPHARLHVTANTNKPFSAGKLRRKTTDLRIQSLYHSAGSALTQENIPMNIRKGRAAAQEGREQKRRKEAKENGIVLERLGNDRGGVKKRKKGGAYAGPRVDMPGVGRMRGSELRISEREARSMEGPRRAGRGRGRGGRR